MNGLIIVVVIILGCEVQAAFYRFGPEYLEIFVDCIDKPGTFGMDPFMDSSEWIVIYDDEEIQFHGTVNN